MRHAQANGPRAPVDAQKKDHLDNPDLPLGATKAQWQVSLGKNRRGLTALED